MYNVLLVDDDESVLRVLTENVNWKNHKVENIYNAQNIQIAKGILENSEIDVVICDIEMPKESGFILLDWIRMNKYDCEFIFLTCHEDFSYAKQAISLDVSAYITKPIDIDTIEFNIHKVLTKIDETRKVRTFNVDKNLGVLKLKFINDIILGEINDIEVIERNITSKKLGIDPKDKFIVLYSRVAVDNEDLRKFGKSLLEYTLERFHFEILFDEQENTNVIKLKNGKFLDFISVYKSDDLEYAKEKINTLMLNVRNYFSSTITCCLSEENDILQLSKTVTELEKNINLDLSRIGTLFYEKDVVFVDDVEKQILDIVKLKESLNTKDTLTVLNFIKGNMKKLLSQRKLSTHTLFLIKQEVMQVVYSELMAKGVQVSLLFNDDYSKELSDHSVDSTIDMIKWIKHMLDFTFDYEKRLEESRSLIYKINEYIHLHYAEDIDRNEVAKNFYLTPEYLAKLYKKETGVSIKNYINDYRIEIAKDRLKNTSLTISEVAESVGFFNFSYFSTIFKKNVGISPQEFRSKYK